MELHEKQIHILLVAEKLFAENTFDGTSVRKIADAAGVNLAMISYYFGSKEKLLNTLLYYRTSDFKIQLDSVLSEGLDHLQKINVVVALVVKRIHRNRRMYKIVHNESSNVHRKIDFSSYIEQKQQNFKFIKALVQKGQKEGVFSKKVNIALIAPTILGTYFNFYYNKNFFWSIHNLPEETPIDTYVFDTLTPHIQRTIKALLTYED